ncbi:MAG: response regulator [Solirubrobacterales bacterium]|nr:response regulator [Solirubrobacterales bacterium]
MSKLNPVAASLSGQNNFPREINVEAADTALVNFDEFLELIPDATIGSRADGTIVLANAEATNVFGYPREQLIGMSVFDLAPGRLHEELKRDRDEFFDHPHRRTIGLEQPLFVRRANGEEFPAEITVSYAQSSEGPIRIAATRDISERLVLERERNELEQRLELDQARRMESIGQLAGGIAHDFNNLLGVIINYAEFAAAELEDLPTVRDDVEQIQSAAHRAAALTNQLLMFSRNDDVAPRSMELNSTLEELERLLRRVIGEHVTLETQFDPELWGVVADPSQIEQVVLNLAVNARDAMPDGGPLTIETANVELDDDFVSGRAGLVEPGRHIRLTVRDAGVGMDAETVERAFEPFFTTKPKPQGTGLGLATVYGIVRSHGGDIFLHSELGVGTTVEIHLPAIEVAASSPLREASPRRARGNSERVLVVEDEQSVRRMVVRALSTNGYDVVSFARAGEALELLRDPEEHIDLLLTDLVMPDLQGGELADRAIELKPDLPVLFMSGYSDLALHRVDDERESVDLIEKPFTVNDLLGEVERVLEKRAV